MSNVMTSGISVVGVGVKQDQEGRFCLNDLHRAAVESGSNARTKETQKFLARPETAELVDELNTQNLGVMPVNSQRGRNGGTFVVKELVYAYAMWISPSFHLKVIRAYDQLQQEERKPEFKVPQSMSEALRLAADQAEQIETQQRELEEARPSVEFVESYVKTESGHKTFRDVCKILGANERRFREFLSGEGIMYKLSGQWIPKQYYIDRGYFTVKTGTNGSHVFNQSKFTPKGINWIAGKWAQHNIAGQLEAV